MDMKLPYNTDAEAAALGSILLDPKLWRPTQVLLVPDDFTTELHRAVYEAMAVLVAETVPLEPIAVATTARRTPLEVQELTREVLVPSLHYAQLVAEAATQRSWVASCERIIRSVLEGGVPGELDLEALRSGRVVGPQARVEMGELLDRVLEDIDRESAADAAPIGTGLPALDRLLGGGLHAGRLYLVGARTGVGKTALVTNIVRHAATGSQPRSAVFHSLEMTAREVAERMLVDAFNLKNPTPSQLIQTMVDVGPRAWPISFLNAHRRPVHVLTDTVLLHRPELVVVDYVQLAAEAPTRESSREQQVSAVTRALKLLAVEAGCVVLACTQLNRAPGREDRPPRLTDLRESGAQEQDADVVLLLHRDAEAGQPETRLRVAKNRFGSTGLLDLYFDGPRTRFREVETR